MLLNAAKYQGYNVYGFRVIKGKPKGEGAGAGWETTIPTSRLGLKCKYRFKLRSK